MARKLGSYLRAYRLRSGLSQKDISFLLSFKSGSTISKTEKGYQDPSVIILLSYCLLFGVSPFDLVPGLLKTIEKNIINRAELLVEQLKNQPKTQMVLHRINFLKNFCSDRAEANSKSV